MIKSKSIQLKREEGDGVRICVMRYVRPEYDYDEWWQDLAPSARLLRSYRNGETDWEEYERRYLAEIEDKGGLLRRLALMSAQQDVTLLCWELDDRRCHRRLLLEKIKELQGSGCASGHWD